MEQKTCQNCINYKKHYLRVGSSLVMAANCGHCIYFKKLKNPAECKRWKFFDEDLAKENIVKALKTMAKRVNEIAAILKNELIN